MDRCPNYGTRILTLLLANVNHLLYGTLFRGVTLTEDILAPLIACLVIKACRDILFSIPLLIDDPLQCRPLPNCCSLTLTLVCARVVIIIIRAQLLSATHIPGAFI